MNYKRIMSLLVLFALLMACTSVAFASGDVDEIDPIDEDFDLEDSSIYESDDDIEDNYLDDDSESDYDDDESDEDWEDDSDYDDSEDEESDDEDWEDDSDYDDSEDEDSDDEDWEDDSDYDDSEDEDSDDEDWEDSDDEDWEDSDDEDWEDSDDEDWEDSDDEDWEDSDDEDWEDEDWEDFDDEYNYTDYLDELEGFLGGNATDKIPGINNDTRLVKYFKSHAYTTMANGGFFASSMPKSDISKEEDIGNENSADNITDETCENPISDMPMSTMMPTLCFTENYQNANPQSSNQASDSISKSIDSSKDNSGKNDIVKKVAKSNSNSNFGILAIIVILLICFAVGYKKFN